MMIKVVKLAALGRELSTKKRRVRFVPDIISVIMKTILNINLALEQFPFTAGSSKKGKRLKTLPNSTVPPSRFSGDRHFRRSGFLLNLATKLGAGG
jgi:hypothetical protein